MPSVSQVDADVSPSITAGLILCALSALKRLDLPRPTTQAVLAATGASRSRAYELKDALLAFLPTLMRPVGRPKEPKAPPVETAMLQVLSQQALRFVAEHPGAISVGAQRRTYTASYRRCVLDLCAAHPEIDRATVAEAVYVPLGTLKDWLRGGALAVDAMAQQVAPVSEPSETDRAQTARIQMLLAAYKQWHGTFVDFCDHAKEQLRIPYGRTLIASILEQYGVRLPRRRSGRSPDEKALRQAFETFFPGAQWQGDGSPISVQVDEQGFDFNLELMVDSHSDAAVGSSIRDEEDSEAVIEAFTDGVQTTGDKPLAVLLDSRPSNHTAKVDDAIGTTVRIRATKGRPQNKAHVEGSFGLFAQTAPPLKVRTATPRLLALQVLTLVVTTFFRTLNGRPRPDRAGRSRRELYLQANPTSEQIELARAALAERCRIQEQAQQTLHARADPIVRARLDAAFERLQLDDPTGNTRAAIARYCLDVVLAAIATFEGKRDANSLPPGVDGGRYLLGIARNIAQQDEGLLISEALLRERLAARDLALATLQRQRDDCFGDRADPVARINAALDHAVDSQPLIDRLFWLHAAADIVLAQGTDQHQDLYRSAARRIHAAFALDYADRLAAVRAVARRIFPLN
jgi:hypothetical protein